MSCVEVKTDRNSGNPEEFEVYANTGAGAKVNSDDSPELDGVH